MSNEETELRDAIERVLRSPSRKKLVVAGPGTGKTTLFKQLLEASQGDRDSRLVLTFINNLKNDLEEHLSDQAKIFTLHGYCLGLLHRHADLRAGLSADLRCLPGLASLIRSDWRYLRRTDPPHFVHEMRNLEETDHITFYLARGNYYDAVDFDDTVYRAYRGVTGQPGVLEAYDLVLVDEYQDFNRLEAGFINLLADRSSILIAGDDDQALYSQLRDSSWDYIRSLYGGGAFEVFELPFCMRCPEVVVDAVNDVIAQAQKLRRLEGRIPKPYKHFAPAKAADSCTYPAIALVATSVQRQNANYLGRYILHAITQIPPEEVEAADAEGYPAVLIIAASPYRSQIITHFEACGYSVDTKRDAEPRLDRQHGLEILKSNPTSNLGWRIVLEDEPPQSVGDIIDATVAGAPLSQSLPPEYRQRILAEVDSWEPQSRGDKESPPKKEASQGPVVRVTSFEGAKGLSAQHVFIAGLHNGEIPHRPADIKDIEICRFVVGLTRTRKKCWLLYTRRFADAPKSPSAFISWIRRDRLEFTEVNAKYWKKTSGA